MKIVKCPTCGGDSVYAASNPYRPFCCERCKNLDFGAWASESFKVPEDSPSDDPNFGDPKVQ
ncbi:MAG TPA: DNA gyrase inhibitor YacG [Ramlibacter sp.]|nr:DNA gyrase inhibitor YacG [Ramlibacter sp.]